jgi:ABC-type sugar transport system substrate-binding protein
MVSVYNFQNNLKNKKRSNKMKTKVFAILVVFLMMVALFTACQKAPATQQPVSPTANDTVNLKDLQHGKPFIYTGNNLAHPTIKLMMLGFWDACKYYDVDCKFIVDAGTDEASLVSAAEKTISFGSSGVDGSSYQQFRTTMIEAQKAGIPVVGTHGNVASEDGAGSNVTGLIAWVAPDPILYGTQVADVIAKQTNCGTPVIVTQSSFNSTEDAADKGFRDEYTKVCASAVVLPVEQEGLEPVAAIAKVSAIILAHPDLKAAFGTTGGSINAWGKAMQQAGYAPGKILMIGMDGTQENIDMVKSGYAYALVNQPVYQENYRAVEILIANLTGAKFDYNNPMPSDIVTKDGLDKLEALAQRSLTDLPK